ncbi:hypothetical protein KAR48_19425 [bacterium]|nr:hypothetical protein [bacterium]
MKIKIYSNWMLFFAMFLYFTPVKTAMGADLDSALNKVVKEMRLSVQRYDVNLETATIALFPFQSNESLARKKVNLAVSEILTQKLIVQSFFKLVERVQLEILLSEQKLGMTGIVESQTAAEVGKMLGARFVALGSIVQVGKSYQISVKLVETSTSEIIGAVIVEVPIKVFDQEASRYLMLVPNQQAIGLYVEGTFYSKIQVDSQPIQSQWDVTVTPANVQPDYQNAIGMGFRYFPFQNWMLDLYVMSIGIGSGDRPFTGSFKENPIYPDELESDLNGAGIRFTLNKTFRITNRFNAIVGLGVEFIELVHKDKGRGNGTFNDGDFVYLLETKKEKAQYVAPLIRVGIEWRVQSRFGLSCFVYGRLSDQKHSIYAALTRQNGYEPYQRETVNLNTYTIHLPQIAVGFSAAFYF